MYDRTIDALLGIETVELELVKKRTTYSLATFFETWTLTFRRFFPLFAAWAVSGALPVAIMVVTVVTGGVLDWINGATHPSWWTLIGILIPAVVMGWFWAGWHFVALKVARGIPVRFSDFFRPANQSVSALVALVITSTLIGLGMLLIIPGALLFLRWQLTPFYIVDRNYGPIKAMKQSWHDTEMMFVPLAMVDLMLWGVALLTAPTLVGPLLQHMSSTVTSALVYSKWLTDENNPEMPRIEGDHFGSELLG